MKSAKEQEKAEDSNLKILIDSLKSYGWTVRREKLSRGPSFRVKSGFCKLFGERVLFLDRELPVKQQHAFLQDFVSSLQPTA